MTSATKNQKSPHQDIVCILLMETLHCNESTAKKLYLRGHFDFLKPEEIKTWLDWSLRIIADEALIILLLEESFRVTSFPLAFLEEQWNVLQAEDISPLTRIRLFQHLSDAFDPSQPPLSDRFARIHIIWPDAHTRLDRLLHYPWILRMSPDELQTFTRHLADDRWELLRRRGPVVPDLRSTDPRVAFTQTREPRKIPRWKVPSKPMQTPHWQNDLTADEINHARSKFRSIFGDDWEMWMNRFYTAGWSGEALAKLTRRSRSEWYMRPEDVLTLATELQEFGVPASVACHAAMVARTSLNLTRDQRRKIYEEQRDADALQETHAQIMKHPDTFFAGILEPNPSPKKQTFPSGHSLWYAAQFEAAGFSEQANQIRRAVETNPHLQEEITLRILDRIMQLFVGQTKQTGHKLKDSTLKLLAPLFRYPQDFVPLLSLAPISFQERLNRIRKLGGQVAHFPELLLVPLETLDEQTFRRRMNHDSAISDLDVGLFGSLDHLRVVLESNEMDYPRRCQNLRREKGTPRFPRK